MKLNVVKITRENGTFEIMPKDWTDAAMLAHITPVERVFHTGRFTWLPKGEYASIAFMARAHGWELVETNSF